MADLFATPYSVDRPSDLFAHRDDHPVQRIGITGMDGEPVPTNRFYSNLYLSTRRQGVWPLPYVRAHLIPHKTHQHPSFGATDTCYG